MKGHSELDELRPDRSALTAQCLLHRLVEDRIPSASFIFPHPLFKTLRAPEVFILHLFGTIPMLISIDKGAWLA
jgi:hypothetical protein